MIPVERELDVAELDRKRRQVTPHISWAALLMKAYGAVAMRWPVLRQAYMRWPWPHIYEHPRNIGLLTVSRRVGDADQLFFGRFKSPERVPLAELQASFQRLREDEITQIRQFKHQARFVRYPMLIRRICWGIVHNMAGASRAKTIGTFGVSLSRVQGCDLTYHLAPVSTVLGCDARPDHGRFRLTLTFDHRLVDAWDIGSIFRDIEAEFHGPLTAELDAMIDAQSGQASGAKRTPAVE